MVSIATGISSFKEGQESKLLSSGGTVYCQQKSGLLLAVSPYLGSENSAGEEYTECQKIGYGRRGRGGGGRTTFHLRKKTNNKNI